MAFKYIKREWQNGKWRYWYNDTKNAVANKTTEAVTNTANKVQTATLNKANSIAPKLDVAVDKAKDAFNKFYDDKNNIYNVTSLSYNEKMAKVKETKEWKDIVARNDPEYVKKNSDGTTTYLLDEYVVKKKHPVLDVVSDIASNRIVDINEITKDTAVAGLKDYATGAITTGMLVAGVASKLLTEKFKLQQGSYDDEINDIIARSNAGAEYVSTIVDEAQNVNEEDLRKMVITATKSAEITKTAKEISGNGVIGAAKILVESDEVKDAYGDNEYYKLAEQSLTNLSDEEIMALNLLLKEMRK